MFYDNLKQACTNKNISVTATLKQIGIGTANGTYWKNGSVPASDIVVKLAEFLEVSTDYLLTGKEKCLSLKLTENEQKILDIFKNLTETQQGQVIERAEMLSEINEDKI